MRVGVLGGTFDPVHIGHLVLAERARVALELDLVLFVPAGEPWRKAHRQITHASHRLAMLQLAVQGNDGFGISDVELVREGPSYTADTLALLAAERLDDEFYFIVGSDALADLPNWHEPERIVRHACLAVAPREAEMTDAGSLGVPGIEGRVVAFEMPRIDVSSTEIRARIAAGTGARYVVPEAVLTYIVEHELYR